MMIECPVNSRDFDVRSEVLLVPCNTACTYQSKINITNQIVILLCHMYPKYPPNEKMARKSQYSHFLSAQLSISQNKRYNVIKITNRIFVILGN